MKSKLSARLIISVVKKAQRELGSELEKLPLGSNNYRCKAKLEGLVEGELCERLGLEPAECDVAVTCARLGPVSFELFVEELESGALFTVEATTITTRYPIIVKRYKLAKVVKERKK